MTASEILNIVLTVAASQLCIDLLANYFVFNNEPYHRAVKNVERLRKNLVKAESDLASKVANSSAAAKQQKKCDRAKDDYGEACSDCARKHSGPGVLGSLFFVVLLRILGSEHKGNVMALLPFIPFKLLGKISTRGLSGIDEIPEDALQGMSTAPQQATSFLFVYLLASMTIKFYVHRLAGVKPPQGADKGLMTMLESPTGQRMAQQLGVDPDDLKMS